MTSHDSPLYPLDWEWVKKLGGKLLQLRLEDLQQLRKRQFENASLVKRTGNKVINN